MKEVLCARTPAVLQCGDLKQSLAFYTGNWGFALVQQVPGVFAVLRRESVTVQLWQRRADEAAQTCACRLLVASLAAWLAGGGQETASAPGQMPALLQERTWGRELGLSDCDGNRLLLVQSASALHRKASA